MRQSRSLRYVPALGLLFVFLLCVGQSSGAEPETPGLLEIHYINVGQGGCTLIIGPNGTRILYDFGAVGGNRDIVPYLRDSVGLKPGEKLHYTIVSHRDRDHYMGYRAVVEAGYDVAVANYDSGSPKPPSKSMRKNWLNPAKTTTAGDVQPIPVGHSITLGDGAEAIVMAANGRIYGDPTPVPVRNENDRSVALLIRYGEFHYLLDGDLGAGREVCTEHQTRQRDVQTRVAAMLVQQGLVPEEQGVDVLHIAHHGSESSTSAAYYNQMKPEIGLISVGLKNKRYGHPRADVVDKILLAGNRPDCVEAPPLEYLFQTEDGESGCLATGCTSNAGLSIGNIKLTTDGKAGYRIIGDNNVHGGEREADPARMWSCQFDEVTLLVGARRCEDKPQESDPVR